MERPERGSVTRSGPGPLFAVDPHPCGNLKLNETIWSLYRLRIGKFVPPGFHCFCSTAAGTAFEFASF
jgi:hypothetical protein